MTVKATRWKTPDFVLFLHVQNSLNVEWHHTWNALKGDMLFIRHPIGSCWCDAIILCTYSLFTWGRLVPSLIPKAVTKLTNLWNNVPRGLFFSFWLPWKCTDTFHIADGTFQSMSRACVACLCPMPTPSIIKLPLSGKGFKFPFTI